MSVFKITALHIGDKKNGTGQYGNLTLRSHATRKDGQVVTVSREYWLDDSVCAEIQKMGILEDDEVSVETSLDDWQNCKICHMTKVQNGGGK